MRKQVTQLTLQEREKTFVLRERGKSQIDIARVLCRNKSTISRELKRNRAPTYNRYSAHSAQRRASKRKKRCGRKHLLTNGTLHGYIMKQLLKEHWSPEIIARVVSKHLPGERISHETIYRYIYSAPKGLRKKLIGSLLRAHRIRRHRGYSRKHTKTHIPQRVSIKERPESINNRLDFGHWGADTIVSRKSTAAIGVCLERKSRYLALDKLRTKSALRMSCVITRFLSGIPENMRQSITYDNGSENTEHTRVNKRLGIQSYFCEPYHSYEKGSVENVIGMIRRYIPKGSDLALISRYHLRKIKKRLNNRPRKCLNYLTPTEVYQHAVALKG